MNQTTSNIQPDCDAVKQYLSTIGRKGGSSKSDKKRAAGRINAAKAALARKKSSVVTTDISTACNATEK